MYIVLPHCLISIDERLYCIQIWCTSFALVASTYIEHYICSLFKPLSAGDSKTTVSTYAALILFDDLADIVGQFRGLTANYSHSESADFVKFLFKWTIASKI